MNPISTPTLTSDGNKAFPGFELISAKFRLNGPRLGQWKLREASINLRLASHESRSLGILRVGRNECRLYHAY